MRALVFGGSGQIGAACAEALGAVGEVMRLARRAGDGVLAYDPFGDAPDALPDGRFDAVIWAQGANMADSVADFDAGRHLDLYRANALYVAETMHRLLASGRIGEGARLCVVSSIWQTLGRPDKLSYMMSKAALQGLVTSAAIDLAPRGILVNAVLPGALDTPMTRANLSPEQIAAIAGATPFGRLPSIGDVAAIAAFLVSPANSSITGQFIAIDLGFSRARLV